MNVLFNNNFNWVIDNLENFSPITINKSDVDIKNHKIKTLSELSLVYYYAYSIERINSDKRISILRNFLLNCCENELYMQMPRKYPILSYNYLFPYFILRATGYYNTYYEEFISRAWTPHLVEYVPYRFLEKEFILWKSKFISREPEWNKLLKKTLLYNPPSPIHINDDSAYAITHTLFYITDFGKRIDALPISKLRTIIPLIEYLLIHYMRIGNWDILGELLINLNNLNAEKSNIYKESAKIFEEACLENGAIPARREYLNSDFKLDQKEDVFNKCYHTTLVSMLYCITSSRKFSL